MTDTKCVHLKYSCEPNGSESSNLDKCVIKTKSSANGIVKRHKARLVAQGYLQR